MHHMDVEEYREQGWTQTREFQEQVGLSNTQARQEQAQKDNAAAKAQTPAAATGRSLERLKRRLDPDPV